jgi:predicted Zn-dependent peptidase
VQQVQARVPAAATWFAWRLPPRDTPEFDACELAMAALGGGQTSRLHQQLVRNLGVAAGAGASAVPLIGGNSFGLVQLRALPGADAGAAIEAALIEVERLATEGPTAAELARAKAQYAREWLSELASLDSRADTISAYTTLHSDPELINRRLADVEAVTLDQVAAACATYLQPGQRAQLDYQQEVGDAQA